MTAPDDPSARIPWAVRIGEADRDGLAALVTASLETFTEREVLLVLRHPHVTTSSPTTSLACVSLSPTSS